MTTTYRFDALGTDYADVFGAATQAATRFYGATSFDLIIDEVEIEVVDGSGEPVVYRASCRAVRTGGPS